MWDKNLTIRELPKETLDKWLKLRMKTTKDILESKLYKLKNKSNGRRSSNY